MKIMQFSNKKLLSGLAGLAAGIGLAIFNPVSCYNSNYNTPDEKDSISDNTNGYNNKKAKEQLKKIQKNNPNISRDLALTLLLISQIPIEQTKPKTPEEIEEQKLFEEQLKNQIAQGQRYINNIIDKNGCKFWQNTSGGKLELARNMLILQLTDPYKGIETEYYRQEIRINLAIKSVDVSTIAERCGIHPDVEKYMDVLKTREKDCAMGLNKTTGVIPPNNELYYLIEGCSDDLSKEEIETRKEKLLDIAEGEDLDSLVGHYYGDNFHKWMDRCQITESGNESYRTAKCLTRAAHNCRGECLEVTANPEEDYNMTEDEVSDLLKKIKEEDRLAPKEVVCTLSIMRNYSIIKAIEEVNSENPVHPVYEDPIASAYNDCLNEQG